MMVLRTLLMIPSAIAFFESLPFSFSFLAMASWIPVSMMSSVSDISPSSPRSAAGSGLNVRVEEVAHAETAIERIGGNPRFMRATRVPAASDHGRLDALTASAGNAFDVEDCERHTG